MKKVLIATALLGMVTLYADPAKIIKGKCASCHGQKMEKVALNKSAIVNKMSAKDIEESLKGYRSGKLNKHGLGGTMKAQCAPLTDAEISDLAKYITTQLNK